MRSSHIQRTIKADAKRRLSLGKLIAPGSQWRAVKEPDGRITLHPVVQRETATADYDAQASARIQRYTGDDLPAPGTIQAHWHWTNP